MQANYSILDKQRYNIKNKNEKNLPLLGWSRDLQVGLQVGSFLTDFLR